MFLVNHTNAVSNAVEFSVVELTVHSADVYDLRDLSQPIQPGARSHMHIAQEARTLGHDCAYFSYDLLGKPRNLLAIFDLMNVIHFGPVRFGTMYYSGVEGGFTRFHWEPEPRPLSGASITD